MGQWSWAILAFEKELNSRAPVKDLVDPFSYFGSVDGILKAYGTIRTGKIVVKK